MSKFKIGDKARIIAPSTQTDDSGKVVTVGKTQDGLMQAIFNDGDFAWYKPEDLELLAQHKPLQPDVSADYYTEVGDKITLSVEYDEDSKPLFRIDADDALLDSLGELVPILADFKRRAL